MTNYLQEVKRRAAAASPGPWAVNSDHFMVCSMGNAHDGKDYHVSMNGYAHRGGVGWEADAKTDAEFVAHARTDVPELAERVEIAEAIVLRAIEDLNEWPHEHVKPVCRFCDARARVLGILQVLNRPAPAVQP